MKATVASFRGAYKSQQASNHVIVHPEGVHKKDAAEKLVNKHITWTSPKGKEIKGKVSAAHGRNGAVRAIFEKGLPGQALGSEVRID
jgi:large subunit ribosomal protein L35Ae